MNESSVSVFAEGIVKEVAACNNGEYSQKYEVASL